MAYLNVEEIEAALHTLAESYPEVTELVPLPNRTPEGRQSHALRIGPADAQAGNTVVATGGMHAREWVPPDALVNLAADLLEAHARGTGLRYGGQRFSADDIRSVVEGLQIVLFPCVNPDGRHHSQTADPMWRKNRRRVRPDLAVTLCGRRSQPQLRRAVGLPPPFRTGFRASAHRMTLVTPKCMSDRPPRPSRRRRTSSGSSTAIPAPAGLSTCTAMFPPSITRGASTRTRCRIPR